MIEYYSFYHQSKSIYFDSLFNITVFEKPFKWKHNPRKILHRNLHITVGIRPKL